MILNSTAEEQLELKYNVKNAFFGWIKLPIKDETLMTTLKLLII